MIVDHSTKQALDSALIALNNEEVFVYPTDTIYGFGGDARSDKVIEQLYDIKGRSEHMPVSMLIHDLDMMRKYARISDKATKLIKHFLPGALTLVLPANHVELPQKLFSVQGYLGFRIPDHRFCSKLTQHFDGPVITTSVNRSGKPALNKIIDIEKQFGNRVNLLIQDMQLEQKADATGSTVIMITKDDDLKILREGSILEKEIRQIF